jgi:DNA polymerase III alpha subunit (gram-positive type)
VTCIFDIETDGLLDQVTKIHVLSYTHDGDNYHSLYDYDEIRHFLSEQKILIGHNIVRYDKPALEKVLGVQIKAKLYDTLPLAWYLDHDQQKHGLEVYGDKYGVPKPVIKDWVG